MHEPSKLGGKGANHQEILAHPVEKSVGGNTGVAGQRGVADEIGPFETLLHRRPAGDARNRVYRAVEEKTQHEPLRCGASPVHAISNTRTCTGAQSCQSLALSHAEAGETGA